MLYPIAAVETCLFAEPLLSNDRCIFTYLVVIAHERVYMPRCLDSSKSYPCT
jgi:hypothetical protein